MPDPRPTAVVPETLEGLCHHPERGRWQAAALLLKSWWPWHSWPLEQALATIDSELNIHLAEFVVYPPVGWGRSLHELPPHLPLPKMLSRAIPAPEAITLLNEILGDMWVRGDSRFGANHAQSSLKKVPGHVPTWRFFSGFHGDDGAIRVDLVDDAYAEFDAKMPVDGLPGEIAVRWAKGSVVAFRAFQLFGDALAQSDVRLT